MSRWWRAYDEAVDDPKLILLTDKQHRAWFNLCCITSQNGGTLPPIAVIAVKLRTSVGKAKHMVAQLVALGLIDEDGNGSFAPHNWKGRQFQSDVSTDRVKRFRGKKRNVSSTVSETPPDTEADTEAERKKDGADASASALERELFVRGKQVLGASAGGMIANLLKSKGGDVALARSAIETASTKQSPNEYIGAILKGGSNETYRRNHRSVSPITAAINGHIERFEREAGDGGEVREASPRLLSDGRRERS